MDSPKDEVKSLKKSLEYVGKLVSTSIIVVLLLIGAFLIYYVVTAKILSKQAGETPKISLYTIVSGSMVPAIKVSDIILNIRVDDFSSLKVGDVITFKSYNSMIANMTITHRIIDIKIKEDNTREFVTKGDYNQSADSRPVQQSEIIGKTVLKIPQLGRIQLLLATKMGWLFIVLIPALGIIIYDILKLFKVLGVMGKAESIEGDIKEVVKKEENKKILETLEKIKKNPLLFANKASHEENISNNSVNNNGQDTVNVESPKTEDIIVQEVSSNTNIVESESTNQSETTEKESNFDINNNL